MRKTVLFISFIWLSIFALAQTPQAIKYQTVARNNAGEILASQNISFRMTILQGALPGTVVYAETHVATTNSSGLATLEIGRGTPVTGNFATINWGTTPIFLKTEVDPAGGSDFIEMGTSELLSVPYSLYAKTAGNGFSGNYNDLSNKPALWDSTWLTIKNKPTTVAGYGITDAMTTTHAANGISTGNIANWNTAYGWGNHAAAGYLTSFTETDPIFGVHPANTITSGNISNWNTAFGWGNHATAGYLTSFSETDPIFGVHPSSGITSGNILNWNTAFGWGNHAAAGYLTSFTETDPIFGAWDRSTGISITSLQVSDFEESVTNNPAMLANTAKNSYPAADAAKLAGIEAGAEVNVNADWNATSGDAQILNKPVGTNPGDMLYWNGTQWIPVPVGSNDQVLKLNNTIPTWTSSIQLPTVITSPVSAIHDNSAVSGGNVSDGGDLIIEKGVCWNISPNPTIADNKTADGGGSGTYISNITGLTLSTTYFVRAYATNSLGTNYGNELSFTTLSWGCGTSFIINHVTSGGVAPVDKTVSYGTVTFVPGERSKCWITKNLGAAQQAASVTDATEASAGWYWQFNLKQGYKCDNATTRTPNTPWITTISENSDWVPAKDPCALELGNGWRIPTFSEWNNVLSNGNWSTSANAFASSLKLHNSGLIYWITPTGQSQRGTAGHFYSSTQTALGYAWNFKIYSAYTELQNDNKANGMAVRCIRD
jgi:uncharacterized protein (TIGR02145 family)